MFKLLLVIMILSHSIIADSSNFIGRVEQYVVDKNTEELFLNDIRKEQVDSLIASCLEYRMALYRCKIDFVSIPSSMFGFTSEEDKKLNEGTNGLSTLNLFVWALKEISQTRILAKEEIDQLIQAVKIYRTILFENDITKCKVCDEYYFAKKPIGLFYRFEKCEEHAK